jgi:hypothetical protein
MESFEYPPGICLLAEQVVRRKIRPISGAWRADAVLNIGFSADPDRHFN